MPIAAGSGILKLMNFDPSNKILVSKITSGLREICENNLNV
jgi:hypothetical protein